MLTAQSPEDAAAAARGKETTVGCVCYRVYEGCQGGIVAHECFACGGMQIKEHMFLFGGLVVAIRCSTWLLSLWYSN